MKRQLIRNLVTLCLLGLMTAAGHAGTTAALGAETWPREWPDPDDESDITMPGLGPL